MVRAGLATIADGQHFRTGTAGAGPPKNLPPTS